MEEVDNPPASSGRAPLPARREQTPGTTELGRKKKPMDGLKITRYLNCLIQEARLTGISSSRLGQQV